MLSVKMICVGRMREKYYCDAFNEYVKRLGPYCRFELYEPDEVKLSDRPSQKEIVAALDKEASIILNSISSDSFVVALCVEGKSYSSEALSALLESRISNGTSKVCAIIGGSYGLSDSVKRRADLCLSMSEMTFPHHLARVMFIEQLYRCFKISEGSRYHK